MIETASQKHIDNMFYENQKKNELKTKKQKRQEEKLLKRLMNENEKVYQLRRKETLYFASVAITEIIPHCIAVLIENDVKVRKNEEEFYLNFNHFSNLLNKYLQLDEGTITSREDFLKYKSYFPKIKDKMEKFNVSKKAALQENFTLEMMHFSKMMNEACFMFEKKVEIALKK